MGKDVQFAEGQIYHIYNRGVEKRKIFLSDKDYLRFIVALYEFNDLAPARNFGYQVNRDPIEVRLQYPRKEQLVEILAFCLMPNHYHLMIRQKREDGITLFMRKLGTGYTNYFNLKYRRVGALFQGKFKAVLLEDESHFTHIPHYIHLNPLDISSPDWRNKRTEDIDKTIEKLEHYKWSSLRDYMGKNNFPTVTNREFLTQCIGNKENFRGRMSDWIKNLTFEFVQDKIIEENTTEV